MLQDVSPTTLTFVSVNVSEESFQKMTIRPHTSGTQVPNWSYGTVKLLSVCSSTVYLVMMITGWNETLVWHTYPENGCGQKGMTSFCVPCLLCGECG